MQATPDSLSRLEALIESNAQAIEQNAKAIKASEEAYEKSPRWNDLQWDAIKFIGTVATSLTIASTVALVGILLRLGSA
ncbi:MAG: hypothetical protein ACFCU8_18335 [Thermosynechococcaceae cyanobacterium]